jgi:hypothetical protein
MKTCTADGAATVLARRREERQELEVALEWDTVLVV